MSSPLPRVHSHFRRALFAAITILLCLSVIEVAARALEALDGRLGGPESQFITPDNVVPAFQLVRKRNGHQVYVRTRYHWIPMEGTFRARKEPGTYRVFCLGGSAAMGWPHEAGDAYPALLRRKLRKLLPGRRVEVLNVGGNTYASYRVKVVFDEIVEYEPDLILIYSGNNEFLEQGVYGTRLPVPWRHSAALRIVSAALPGRGGTFDVGGYGVESVARTRMNFAFGVASVLRRDPEQFQLVRNQYRHHIATMVRTARERGIDVMLLTVPVNLADWRPNVSANSVDGPQRRAWQASYRKGVFALEGGRPDEAIEALRAALELDEQHAATWYSLGRALRARGRDPEALTAFETAVEHDAYPFRSLFNEDLREIAAAEDVQVVDLVAMFARHSPGGLVGLDQFVDYVHPTVASNERIAHAIVERLVEREALPGQVKAEDLARVRIPIAPDVEEGLSALVGLFSQFLIMRQYDAIEEIGRRLKAAVARERDESALPAALGKLVARVDWALEVVGRYKELVRSQELGIVEDTFSAVEADAIYRDYAAMMRRIEAVGRLSEADLEAYIPTRRDGAP